MFDCTVEQKDICEKKFAELFQLIQEIKEVAEKKMSFDDFYPWIQKLEVQYINLLEEFRDMKANNLKEIFSIHEKINIFILSISDKVNDMNSMGQVQQKSMDDLSDQFKEFASLNTERIDKIYCKLIDVKIEENKEKNTYPWYIRWFKDPSIRNNVFVVLIFVGFFVVVKWEDVKELILAIFGK